MSARKIDGFPFHDPGSVTVEARQTRLTLSPDSVVIHRGGIVFQCQTAFSKWVEMTVTLRSPVDGKRVNCSGVVVDCVGNKHAGYRVSMVFTGMSKHAETRLSEMAHALPR